jgi:hypothetical protein
MFSFPPNPFRLGGFGFALALASCAPAQAAKTSTSTGSDTALECGLDGAAVLEPHSQVSGSVALARHGTRTLAFIADEDTKTLEVRDLDLATPGLRYELSGAPSSVLVHESGAVAVTISERSRVEVVQFKGDSLEARCAVPTASEPVASALSPDGRHLLVVSAWGAELGSYASRGLGREFRMPLARDPRAIVLDEGGKNAYVSHGVGGVLSVVDLHAKQLREVSLNAPLPPERASAGDSIRSSFQDVLAQSSAAERVELETMMQRQLANLERPERFGSQGFALAVSVEPRGRIFVPQVEVDPGMPETRSSGYGNMGAAAVTPGVAVIDQNTLEPHRLSVQPPAAWVSTQLVAGREACRLPRAAAIDAQGVLLLVACLGADTLIGYDAASPSPIDAEVLRIPVAAGPTGVAVDPIEHRAVVWSQFARTLSIVELPLPGAALSSVDPKPRRIALERDPERELSPELALGRRLFFATDDPRIAADGRGCATCHVGGRDDGLTWSTPNGPRRTKSLAATLSQSAPYSWDGAAETLHDQLRSTFERLAGQGGLRSADLDALVQYITSLPPPPRGEADVEASLVRRGEAVFRSAETACATCHQDDHGTDKLRHDVASNVDADVTPRFDTPTLRFLEGRAPYFHDGRYTSLAALLHGSDGTMGHTSHLSDADMFALEAFLTTL